jgi:hypothetical protein
VTLSIVDGLTARSVSQIQFLERSRLGPGSVARALTEWKRTVRRRDVSVLFEEIAQHGCPCCDPTEAREVLQQTLSLLEPRARRELWAIVEPLDELFRSRTIHDPHSLPGQPWWLQRA